MKQSLESRFTLDRKELHQALLTFKRLIKRGFDKTICTVRIMPGGIEISTPGILRNIHGETEGLYEFLVPVKIIMAYTASGSNKNMSFVLREGQMECDKSTFSSPMIKMKNWQAPPVDELPINFTDIDVIKLGHRLGTDYLKEKNLEDLYRSAMNTMELDIHSTMEILSKYEVEKDDVRSAILFRIKKNLGLIK